MYRPLEERAVGGPTLALAARSPGYVWWSAPRRPQCALAWVPRASSRQRKAPDDGSVGLEPRGRSEKFAFGERQHGRGNRLCEAMKKDDGAPKRSVAGDRRQTLDAAVSSYSANASR